VRRGRLFHQQLESGSIGVDLASLVDVSARPHRARAFVGTRPGLSALGCDCAYRRFFNLSTPAAVGLETQNP
jgi:hypothetical protein